MKKLLSLIIVNFLKLVDYSVVDDVDKTHLLMCRALGNSIDNQLVSTGLYLGLIDMTESRAVELLLYLVHEGGGGGVAGLFEEFHSVSDARDLFDIEHDLLGEEVGQLANRCFRFFEKVLVLVDAALIICTKV